MRQSKPVHIPRSIRLRSKLAMLRSRSAVLRASRAVLLQCLARDPRVSRCVALVR